MGEGGRGSLTGGNNGRGIELARGRGSRRTAGCKQEISRCSWRNERAARPRVLKSYCREGVACCVANVNAATFIPYDVTHHRTGQSASVEFR